MNNRLENGEINCPVAQKLQARIIEKGRITPDGIILSLEDLNRDVDVKLTGEIAQKMAQWVKTNFKDINPRITKVAVVESSGNMLAYEVAKQLCLDRAVTIKKGHPSTYYGEVLEKEIHSTTRGKPTTISFERRHLTGMRVIGVDDFWASGDSAEALKFLVEKAGGKLIAICAAACKPGQGSKKIMEEVPAYALVEIEEMTPDRNGQPATIKFAGQPPIPLKRRWTDGESERT